MKKTRRRLALSGALLICVAQASYVARPHGASAAAREDNARIARLAALGKLWGAIKFFHPYVAYKDIDWDDALVQTIPKVNEAKSADEYRAAVAFMLSFLKDPNTRVSGKETGASAPAPRAQSVAQPYLRWAEGNVAVIVATDYAQFVGSQEKAETFRKLFAEAAKARGIVFDLRRAGGENTASSFWFASNFSQALPFLLDEDLALPAIRHRAYSGYPTQSGQTSGGYYSGFVTADGGAITARGAKGSRKPMAFLINSGTEGVHSALAGLQAAGRATVVQEVESSIENGVEKGVENGVEEHSIELADDVTVLMRTSEFVSPDGGIGFRPDLSVPASPESSADSSPAMAAAVKAARGEASTAPKSRQAAPAAALKKGDKLYAEMTYPTEPYRLLALFRFWNIINYFYPYKHLIDRPWDGVLTEYIPKLESAGNALEYTLTVAEMVTNIQDSHGFISSSTLNQYVGVFRPPIEVRLVQGQTVITNFTDEAIRQSSGLSVGDVLVSVDGEEVAKRRDRLGRIFAASTPQALQRRVHSTLLNGPEKSQVTLVVKNKDGKLVEATLQRTARPLPVDRKYPVYTVLPEGVGYMDLARLTVQEVDAAFEAIKNTPGVIFDIRGYPKGTAWAIAPRLTDKAVVTSLFERNEPHSPDPTFATRLRFNQMTWPSGKWRYTGKVVALINEDAISQSEHTCLFLEAAADATFIGSPTNGANGDVTTMLLPGGISVNFSGHDVRHADGRQLQRLGIQPHIKVEPTIDGVRSGRDEVLERAVEFLKMGGRR
jgi:C-terminal processing protease CtpA/Prc